MPEGSRTRAALGVVLLLGLLLCAVPIGWGLPAWGSWDPAEILPSQVLQAGTWPAGQPELQRAVLRALFAPAEALAALGLVPGGWYGYYNSSFLVGRLLSVLLATGAVYLTYRVGRELSGRTAGLAAAAIAAVLPPLAFYGKTVNLEAPALFWFTLSLLFLGRLLRRQRVADYLLFALSAALAVSTRTGTAWLYPLAPLPIWAALYARARGASPLRRAACALGDWRPWLAALCALTLVAAIGDLPGQLERLAAGLASARPAAAASALRLAAATSSWPGLVAALLGVGILAAERRWRALAPLLLVAPLPLGLAAAEETSPQGLFLPLAVVAALMAGRLFAGAGLAGGRDRLVLVAAAGLVMLLAVRAIGVDLAMAADPRAALEAWLARRAPDGRVAALGPRHRLPRGIPTFGWEGLEGDPCRLLDGLGGALLVVNRSDAGAPGAVLRRLEDGELGYDPAFEASTPRVPGSGAGSWTFDLARLDQALVVFERAERPCVAPDRAQRALAELARSRDPELRRILAAVLLREELARKSVIGPARSAALGLRFDAWTYGAEPAALAVANDLERPAVPRLRLGCLAPAAELPVRVSVDDGGELREITFERAGEMTVDLGILAPGARQLILIRADKSWRPAGPDNRPLGVSLLEVSLVPR